MKTFGYFDGVNIFCILKPSAKYIFLTCIVEVLFYVFVHAMPAVQFYRRAVQLVPDIESKIDFLNRRLPRGECRLVSFLAKSLVSITDFYLVIIYAHQCTYLFIAYVLFMLMNC